MTIRGGHNLRYNYSNHHKRNSMEQQNQSTLRHRIASKSHHKESRSASRPQNVTSTLTVDGYPGNNHDEFNRQSHTTYSIVQQSSHSQHLPRSQTSHLRFASHQTRHRSTFRIQGSTASRSTLSYPIRGGRTIWIANMDKDSISKTRQISRRQRNRTANKTRLRRLPESNYPHSHTGKSSDCHYASGAGTTARSMPRAHFATILDPRRRTSHPGTLTRRAEM